MPETAPFDNYPRRYEDWFEKNKYAYKSELKAIKEQLSDFENGMEVGVGSGRFAEPLGIKLGVEPSEKMREIARVRRIKAIDGVAENLPFDNSQFDFVLMVTTICFVDNIDMSFKEVHRVLEPEGFFIIGFVDKNSHVGKLYQEHKKQSVFYRTANFFTVDEVLFHLKKSGFKKFKFNQTIFKNLSKIKNIEPVREGYGEGAFAVIRAEK